MKGKHGKDSKWRKLMVLSLAVMMAIVFMPAGVMADGTAAQEQGSTKATVQESNASGTASGTENQPAVKQDASEETASQDDNAVQSGQEQSDTAQDTVKESSDTQTNEESKADKEANQISDTDVASVNGQGYATLQDAMKNAAAGDTITVLKDFTLTDQLAVDKAITLDLGGHTITNAVTGSQQAITARMIDSLSIQNGAITGGGVKLLYAYKCNVSLKNLMISNNKGKDAAVETYQCNKVVLDHVKFTGNTRVFSLNVSGELNVSDCNIVSNGEGSQSVLVGVNGDAVKTFTNCTFTNNYGHGIISASQSKNSFTIKNCDVTGNTTESGSTLSAKQPSQTKPDVVVPLVLDSTVIENNTCVSPGFVAGVDARNFSSITIKGDSAVYNNRNTSNEGYFNDFSSNSDKLIEAVKKMKDPSGGIESFEDYTIDSKGTVKPEEGSQKPEAAIGDTTYMTLQDAITHAASGDIIKLIWTNKAGDIKDITLSGEKAIKIDKELTIDLNGHNVHYRTMGSSGESSTLSVAKGGALTLVNTGEKKPVSIEGRLRAENGAKSLSVGTGVKVNTIRVDDSNTAVTIDGSQGDLTLEGSLIGGKDNNPPITFGKDFQTNGTIIFDLGSDITGKLNSNNSNAESVDDIRIADGATEEIAGHVVLKGVNSPLVSVICKNGNLLVHKEKANVLYLDPVTGHDDNTGIDADQPLETVRGAVDKVSADPKENTLVMVMNTITVTKEEDWKADKKNIEFMRYQDLKNGPLVSIKNGGNLKLTNITLDGNAKMQTGSSIVSVESGGTLNIGGGAVLQNNKMNSSNAAGGAVYVSGEKSTVNMSGGIIENNEAVWGGGISAWNNAVVNMSGGIIRSNSAVSSSDSFLGRGGGVLLDNGAVMNLSGGEICSNSADEAGGGIHVGNVVCAKGNNGTTNSRLNMTCGKIEGNTAVYNGGGIYIEGGTENTYGIAEITGGKIISNSVTNTTNEKFFGGGGIYVNANPHRTDGYNQYGRLYLSNASITGNSAELDGGGYAACPCSVSELYDEDSAIYNNKTASSKAKDIYISAIPREGDKDHTGNPKYTIPSVMAGNVSCRWLSDEGTEVRYDYLSGVLKTDKTRSLHTDAVPSSSYKPAVTISGNTSGTRGGGIGSNGAVYMGSKPDPTTSVTAQKTWKGTPASGVDQIQVELYRNVKGDETNKMYIGYMNLSPDGQGNWTNKVTFENLPKQSPNRQEYEYTVGEKKVPGYDATVSQDKDTKVFTISNAPTPTPVTPTPTPTKRITVQKVWKLDDGGTRPDSVQVQLMKNGAVYGSPVTLSDANNWTATWDNLDGSSNVLWTAEEVNAPEGFTASQQTVGDKIIITNDDQKTKKNDPDTPQTPDNPTTPNKPTNPKSSGGSGSGSNTPVSPSVQNTTITSTTPASSVPRTADSARLGTMLIMFGGAAAALAAVLVMKRRENK